MLDQILAYLPEVVAVLLYAIGFMLLLLHKNLIKKIIGLNIMDTSMYLFLASMGYIQGNIAPILTEGATVADYINPIPSGLVLTGIVVSVSTTALMLALVIRLYRAYHTLNLDEIYIEIQRGRR